jgi:hypothetical protein
MKRANKFWNGLCEGYILGVYNRRFTFIWFRFLEESLVGMMRTIFGNQRQGWMDLQLTSRVGGYFRVL